MTDAPLEPAPPSRVVALGPRLPAARPVADYRPLFAREVDELFKRRLRIAATVLLTLHGIAVVLFEDRTGSQLGVVLRIALVPFVAAILAATWIPRLGSGVRFLSALMIAGASGYATWVNVKGGDAFGSQTLSLAIVGGGLLFPFTAVGLSALAATVLGFYLYGALTAPVRDGAALANGIFFLVASSAIAALAAALSSRLREREFRGRFELERANEQTEALLRNMLPASIVDRIKQGEGSVADRIEPATVMFIDIVGFTKMSAVMPPEQVVRFLNDLFSELDAMTAKRGLEKIKTIGDAYMVGSGVPEGRPDHADAAAWLALEIRDLVKSLETPDGNHLDVRIGIHTGPVVAGVIGVTKLSYDLWGDTVNTASRMESHGEPGVIQVSEATYQALGGAFRFESRGTIQVKGKGAMNVYALLGPV